MDECEYKVYQYDSDVIIHGYFTVNIDNNILYYIAPAPPDYRSSFSGSALPYANEKQAFDNTPNIGKVILDKNNFFSISLSGPNQYYNTFTNTIITPYVSINYKIYGIDKKIEINLNNLIIPYRSLSHNQDRNEIFYSNEKLPIRSQEDILRDSKYPTTNRGLQETFWGLKPAC